MNIKCYIFFLTFVIFGCNTPNRKLVSSHEKAEPNSSCNLKNLKTIFPSNKTIDVYADESLDEISLDSFQISAHYFPSEGKMEIQNDRHSFYYTFDDFIDPMGHQILFSYNADEKFLILDMYVESGSSYFIFQFDGAAIYFRGNFLVSYENNVDEKQFQYCRTKLQEKIVLTKTDNTTQVFILGEKTKLKNL